MGEATWGPALENRRFWRCVDGLREMGFVGAAVFHSGSLQLPIALDVGSKGREMDFEFGFGKPDPSHLAKMIAAFPGPEDFFDSQPHRLKQAVVRFERFGRQPTMAFAHKLRGSSRGDDRLFDGQSVIGFVGVNLAGLFRDDRRSDSNIGLIGRRRLNLADDAGVLVGGNMRLIAMRQGTAFVLCPGRLFIFLAHQADRRRIDQRSFADSGALRRKIARDGGKQALTGPVFDKQAATKGLQRTITIRRQDCHGKVVSIEGRRKRIVGVI
jgi:hypothetical protein